MHISLLPIPESGLIARETLAGGFEGEFYQQAGGQIYYRHEADKRHWYANRDIQTFRASAAAYEQCQATVRQTADEAEQSRHVDGLRAELGSIEPLGKPDTSYWAIILEQMEEGLL